jgi:hypothetical protein
MDSPDARRLYALVHVQETLEDVPPAHETPNVRLVALTVDEYKHIRGDVASAVDMLGDADDNHYHYLDLVQVPDTGGFSEAEDFINDLIAKYSNQAGDELVRAAIAASENPTDLVAEQSEKLAEELNDAGITAALLGSEFVFYQHHPQGQVSTVRLNEPPLRGLVLPVKSTVSVQGQPAVVLYGDEDHGGAVEFCPDSREWFPHSQEPTP